MHKVNKPIQGKGYVVHVVVVAVVVVIVVVVVVVCLIQSMHVNTWVVSVVLYADP